MLTTISKEEIESDWKKIRDFFSEKFSDGEKVTIETMLFLIGVQELGSARSKFTKDEKIDLMHMATCKLLEPFGYFELENTDIEGWKYYKQVQEVSDLKKMEQFEFFQKAIVVYFRENVWN